MTHHADDILLLELNECVTELSFFDLLLVANEAIFGLRVEVLVQVLIFDARSGHSLAEVLLCNTKHAKLVHCYG